MSKKLRFISLKIGLIALVGLSAAGCVSTVVGVVVDTAIEAAKVPIKVGAAVVDVVTPEKLVQSSGEGYNSKNRDEALLQMEQDTP